jgi:hypothetical protein
VRPDDLALVNRYLDGELDSEDKAAFEERLLTEAPLSGYLNEVRALNAEALALKVYHAPEVSFSRGIMRPFHEIGYRIRPIIAGAAVAAVCILAGIGIGKQSFQKPLPGVRIETFRLLYHAPGANSVAVLGDFNGWSDEIPLKPRGEGGYWLAEIQVKPGEYRYILMVDGKEQPGDPLADYVIDDDFGSKNSVVRIGL